jgi:hypothetical protein
MNHLGCLKLISPNTNLDHVSVMYTILQKNLIISNRFAGLPGLGKSNFNYLTEMKVMVFLTHALAAGERGIEKKPVKVKLNH